MYRKQTDTILDDSQHFVRYRWLRSHYEAEMWRWKTIKTCTEALTRPVSHLDPRVEMKRDFKRARDQLIASLNSAVAEMVPSVDPEITKSLGVLVKKSAAFWAGVQAQRFRLMVVMPTEEAVNQEKLRVEDLEATAVPGLTRWGDENGHNLHESAFVGAYEPKRVKLEQ
jgi:hypothetical protein